MSSNLMRRYIDILNENSQPQQLDEGMMDMLKPIAQKALNFLKPYSGEIAAKVQQATGGDTSLNLQNAVKVAQALGFDKMLPKDPKQPVAEGIAPDWKGKFIQFVLGLPILQTLFAFLGSEQAQRAAADLAGLTMWQWNNLAMIGLILLMAAPAIYGGENGQLGHNPDSEDLEGQPFVEFLATHSNPPYRTEIVKARSAREAFGKLEKKFPDIPVEMWGIREKKY